MNEADLRKILDDEEYDTTVEVQCRKYDFRKYDEKFESLCDLSIKFPCLYREERKDVYRCRRIET